MSLVNRRNAAIFTLATFTASACSTDATAPASQLQLEAAASVADDGLTPFLNQKVKSRFYCYTANRLADSRDRRYMHRTLWLRFPKRFELTGGATQTVQVEWPDNNGKRFAAANCTIPDTREALNFLLEKHFLQDPKSIRVPGINRQLNIDYLRGSNSQLAPPTQSRKYQLATITVVASNGSFWTIGGGHFNSYNAWSGESVASWNGDPNPPAEVAVLATPDPAENDAESAPPGLPNCTDPPQTRTWTANGWCYGDPPNPVASNRIFDALTRMNAKGGVCSTLAGIGYYLLAHDAIRIVDGLMWGFSGAASPSRGTNGWLVLSDFFTTWAYDADHATTVTDRELESRTLQQILAHELDHLNGQLGHSPNGYETTNSQVCSDLPQYSGPAQ